jgi:hypothetical protein
MGITRKKGFDSLLTGLSNCTFAFVFNKSAMGGGGLAEGHRQKVARKPKTFNHRGHEGTRRKPLKTYANMRCLGILSRKSFSILVDG